MSKWIPCLFIVLFLNACAASNDNVLPGPDKPIIAPTKGPVTSAASTPLPPTIKEKQPDRIAISCSEYGNPEVGVPIYVVEPDSPYFEQLSEPIAVNKLATARHTKPNWSQDGKLIAFNSDENHQGMDSLLMPNSTMYSMDLAGNISDHPINAKNGLMPTWMSLGDSNESRIVLYVSPYHSFEDPDNPDISEIISFYDLVTGDGVQEPIYMTPDGWDVTDFSFGLDVNKFGRLVYVASESNQENGGTYVYTQNSPFGRKDNPPVRLDISQLEEKGEITQVRMSPYGRSILIVAITRDPVDQIPLHSSLYLMPTDAGEAKLLTKLAKVSIWDPAWSPDESRISFHTEEGFILMNVETLETKNLFDYKSKMCSGGSWKPDRDMVKHYTSTILTTDKSLGKASPISTVPFVSTTVIDIYREFSENPFNFDDKYNKTILEITGIITDIYKGYDGTPNVEIGLSEHHLLQIQDPNLYSAAVTCVFSLNDLDNILSLRVGDHLTLKGKYDTSLSDPSNYSVMLHNCEVFE